MEFDKKQAIAIAEEILDLSQVNELLALNFNGIRVINDPRTFYEILGAIVKLGYGNVIEPLKVLISKSDHQPSFEELVFISNAFDESKLKYQSELTKLRRRYKMMKGIMKCPSCKSINTVTIEMQTRGADEAIDIITKCNQCGKVS